MCFYGSHTIAIINAQPKRCKEKRENFEVLNPVFEILEIE